MFQELLDERGVMALWIVRPKAKEFVECKGYHAGQIETLFAVHSNEFAIGSNRSAAGRQAKNRIFAEVGPLSNQVRDGLGRVAS